MIVRLHDAEAPRIAARMRTRELHWCLRFNRLLRYPGLERVFARVSRLGDGVFWYGLIVALPLVAGPDALPVVARMLGAGMACLLLYRWIKRRTGRPRPCQICGAILAPVAPLDHFSFPSGHTLHAVAFTVIAVSHYPVLGVLLIPFTVLVGLSRLVLGLHYPSDVIAGAVIGAMLAGVALAV